MKKILLVAMALVLCFSLFACGNTTEKPDDENKKTEENNNQPPVHDYTAEEMVEEIKMQFDGEDVSEVVAEKNIETMTPEEKVDFMGYLYDYAKYKDSTTEKFVEEFKEASPETVEKIKEELSNQEYDNTEIDKKIEIGEKLTVEYMYYDYTEVQAIEAVMKSYLCDEETAAVMLQENGYYESEEQTERSKVLYLLLVEY